MQVISAGWLLCIYCNCVSVDRSVTWSVSSTSCWSHRLTLLWHLEQLYYLIIVLFINDLPSFGISWLDDSQVAWLPNSMQTTALSSMTKVGYYVTVIDVLLFYVCSIFIEKKKNPLFLRKTLWTCCTIHNTQSCNQRVWHLASIQYLSFSWLF